MHEYAIAKGIVNVVLSTMEGRDSRVTKVWVKAGVARAIVPEALDFSFDVIKKKHNNMRDSELKLTIVPIQGICNRCGEKFTIEEVIGICPKCNSSNINFSTGNELFVEKIEVEI
ncbi:hypothetical protein DRQ33_03730 [bacterium]|nr:MAG: hypothetical protein DRQ33_03730 [bacterium]